jgi:predicted dinucleotide-utilizing enzyme
MSEELEAVELDSEELTNEKPDSEELSDDLSEELSDDSEELEEEEYEEITSEEVDSVVGQLETIIESVSSENIKSHLEEALNSIYFLVYDEDDLEDEDDELLADAA